MDECESQQLGDHSSGGIVGCFQDWGLTRGALPLHPNPFYFFMVRQGLLNFRLASNF